MATIVSMRGGVSWSAGFGGSSHTKPIVLLITPALPLECLLHLDHVSFRMPNHQVFYHLSHGHCPLPHMYAGLAPLRLGHVTDVIRRRVGDLLQLTEEVSCIAGGGRLNPSESLGRIKGAPKLWR